MSDIKLIALDLDETLLRTDLIISPRAKEAIGRAVEGGTAVTLATGRMFSAALPYALELGLDLPLITYQGALVKYASGNEVYHRPLTQELARDLVEFLLPYGYHLNLYINDELYMLKDSPEGQRYAAMARVPVHLVDNLAEVLSEGPSKLLVIAESEKLDSLIQDMSGPFSKRANITKSRSNFLEITHPEATKGRALAGLAKNMGLETSQVMAIGDSLNDLDMIKYAGLGVAMENAVQELKDNAQYITRKNDDDGVAEAIEKMVLNK